MVIRGPSHTKIPMMRLRFPARSEFRAVKAAALAAALVAAGTASAQDGGLFDKIFGGSERMNPGGVAERAAAPAPAAQDRNAQMGGPDKVVRLDRLESQIRQLTGVIEQLQYRNQQ